MKSFTYVIQDPVGLHARPAGLAVKEAKKFQSDIRIKVGDKQASMTKLIQVMGLGVVQGNEVCLEIEGEDEEAAYEALKAFFEANL